MPPRKKKVLKQKQKQTQRQTVTVHINAPKAARKRKPRAKKPSGSGSGSSQAVVAVPYMASNPNPSYGMFSAGDVNKFSSLIPQQQPAQEANPTVKTEVYKAADNPFITNYKNERSPVLDDKKILQFLEEKNVAEEKDDEFTHEEREEPKNFEVENPLIEPEQEVEDADENEARERLKKKSKNDLISYCINKKIEIRERYNNLKSGKNETRYIDKKRIIDAIIKAQGNTYSI